MGSKSKKEKPKKESSDNESSIAVLLRDIRGNIKEIKADNREIKTEMKDMNSKIILIEKKQKESEEKTSKELKEIREEINSNNEVMKETIAIKVINEIEPLIPKNSVTLNAEDVKRIVVKE